MAWLAYVHSGLLLDFGHILSFASRRFAAGVLTMRVGHQTLVVGLYFWDHDWADILGIIIWYKAASSFRVCCGISALATPFGACFGHGHMLVSDT